MNEPDILSEAKRLIRAEADVLNTLADQLDDHFVQAVQMVTHCPGNIIVTGAGTSGAVAKRLAHLLSTCGIPSFYVTPGDALHGESALLGEGTLLIAISKAGKSTDINQFARIARDRGSRVMGWTSNPQSDLALLSHLVITLPINEHAEGEGLLPFGSTLTNSAFGDALCLMAKRLRGFDLGELAHTHPMGGAHELAKQVLTSSGQSSQD